MQRQTGWNVTGVNGYLQQPDILDSFKADLSAHLKSATNSQKSVYKLALDQLKS